MPKCVSGDIEIRGIWIFNFRTDLGRFKAAQRILNISKRDASNEMCLVLEKANKLYPDSLKSIVKSSALVIIYKINADPLPINLYEEILGLNEADAKRQLEVVLINYKKTISKQYASVSITSNELFTHLKLH